MNPFAHTDLGLLAIFALAVLVASAGAVFLSGLFPANMRPWRLRGLLAGVLIWTGLAVTLALAVAAVLIAVNYLPWAMAIVVGGLAFLLAPFLVQPLPARLRDSKAGALVYTCAGAACMALFPIAALFGA